MLQKSRIPVRHLMQSGLMPPNSVYALVPTRAYPVPLCIRVSCPHTLTPYDPDDHAS